jgi:hypothetical protein
MLLRESIRHRLPVDEPVRQPAPIYQLRLWRGGTPTGQGDA